MSNEYFVNADDLTKVANAVREKGETSETLAFPNGFVTAIQAIKTGERPSIVVTAPVGSTIEATCDSGSITAEIDDTGVAVIEVPEYGDWTVTALLDGNVSNAVSITVVKEYSADLYFANVYGIQRDITSSSPEWTRTNKSANFVASASVGTVAGSSDFDNCYPWSDIERVTLETGDVMVKIPKFYYRRYREGNIEHIEIADRAFTGFSLHPLFNHGNLESDCAYIGAYKTSSSYTSVSGASPSYKQTRATHRTNAKAKGDGWGIIDIAAVSAIQMLIMIEFATNNVQDAIGRGHCDSNSTFPTAGGCDDVLNLTGIPSGTDGKTGVVWRGLENFWGGQWEMVDGVNFNNGTYYVCNNPSVYADETLANYEALSYVVGTSISSQYVNEVGLDTGNNSHVMLPCAATGGSAETFYCDTCSTSTSWRIFKRGGTWSSASVAGLFADNFTGGSSSTGEGTGSRLLYIPNTNA